MKKIAESTTGMTAKRTAGRRALLGAVASIGAVIAGIASRESRAATAGGEGFGGITLVNRLKIMEEIAKYSWAWDSGDFEAYLARYFEDGYLEHPNPDGSPGKFVGHDTIRAFLSDNIKTRPTNSYALQHLFTSLVLSPEGPDVRVNAYCDVLRHEFHRQYWPHGPSFRMGTWHALYGERKGEWRIKGLTVKMWTDTAFNSGTAIQIRPPGSPGTR